jgi:hypothetical protein
VTTQLFRIAIRRKETDKRKNATVYHYVVMATTLEEAKTLAVAKWVDPPEYDYRTNDLDKIAAVSGNAMETLVYNSDIRGSSTKGELPETLPTAEAVEAARAVLAAFEAAYAEPEVAS